MKTPKELGITKQHFNNLLKLANFLNNKKNLPKKVEFNMSAYCEPGKMQAPECGTIGCAAGFGPFAGVRKAKNEVWRDYLERVFTGDDASEEIYDWLFSSFWSEVDNTPKGAARRIFWFLKNGIPANSHEQRFGKASLCYNTSHLEK